MSLYGVKLVGWGNLIALPLILNKDVKLLNCLFLFLLIFRILVVSQVLGDFVFILCIIDDYSRVCWVFILILKADATIITKNDVYEMKTQLGASIEKFIVIIV